MLPKPKESPEFQDFLQAYLHCAFWSSTVEKGETDSENPDDWETINLDDEYAPDALEPEALEMLESIAHVFFCDVWCYLAAIADPDKPEYEYKGKLEGSTIWGMAGHDLWLTSQGHGAGFWDGDWPDPYGEMFTDKAGRSDVNFYITATNEIGIG